MKAAKPFYVLLAAFFWGLSGGIAGCLLNRGWDPCVIAFYRAAAGFVFILVWMLLRPHTRGFMNPILWFWSIIAGLGVAGNFTGYFISIETGHVAIAATLMYCAPVFVYLISFCVGQERATPLKWGAIAIVVAGIILLTELYDVNAKRVTGVSIMAGLSAGLSYAVFIFGFKNAAKQGSPQLILLIAFSVLACVLIGPADSTQLRSALHTADWRLFAALGILGAGVSFILYIVGLKHTAPSVAAIVAMVEPVTASLFGVVVLGERLSRIQIGGMLLILIVVTALSVYTAPRRHHPIGLAWLRHPH